MSTVLKHSLSIRPVTSDDKDFILSLVPRFVAFDLPRARRKRDCLAAIRADVERALREAGEAERFFVASDANGESTGFLHLQIQRDFFSGERACHVSDIAVTATHEGKGIGRALIEYSRQWAKKHHCKLLTLSVFPGNARARALYESAGFAPDLVRMAKPVR